MPTATSFKKDMEFFRQAMPAYNIAFETLHKLLPHSDGEHWFHISLIGYYIDTEAEDVG